MYSEPGLLIIWSNGRNIEDKIEEDIRKHFDVLYRFCVTWKESCFSSNLTRFYGENLPPKCNKEKDCGTGPFMLFVLEDNSPIYGFRKTSRGKKYVNVNFFDAKEMYRSWTGGNQIHATNDINEFTHDIRLLLGMDLLELRQSSYSTIDVNQYGENIVGSDGWDSLSQLFSTLNDTVEYVVLRNFDNLPDVYEYGEHSDIDFLSRNRENFVRICNAKQVYKQKFRSKYELNINKKDVYIDVRFVGDEYYCESWENNILEQRMIINKCIYVPDENNFYFSLMYHGLIQKRRLAEEYLAVLYDKFGTDNLDQLFAYLTGFMADNKYTFTEPNDLSVYFNNRLTEIPTSFRRGLYWKYVDINDDIRTFARRIKNQLRSI